MCLNRIFRGKEKREALAILPETFRVWKYLYHGEYDGWWTEFSRERVYAGQMKASYLGRARYGPSIGHALWGPKAYQSGWHAIVSSGHPGYRGDFNTRCLAHKRHIRAIGLQGGRLCVVLSHITFPKKCGKPKGSKR